MRLDVSVNILTFSVQEKRNNVFGGKQQPILILTICVIYISLY